MNEEEQDAMIRRLAEEALRPPPVPTDQIWARIQAARASADEPSHSSDPQVRPFRRPRALFLALVGAAAMLVLAFGLGRWSARPGAAAPQQMAAGGGTAAVHVMAAEYLGHTEVFLTDFRAAARSGRPDSTAPAQARRLLGTARLLLDSRAAEDVRLRALLEDLELVLAEISQLPAAPHDDVKLITDGLDRRGMLDRLRSAVPAGSAPTTTQGVS